MKRLRECLSSPESGACARGMALFLGCFALLGLLAKLRQLVFSGGPGDGSIHETESMRRMAVKLGVPDSAIVRDEAGLNTAATLRNTRPLLAAQPAIAVSEFYHLPRIKLAAASAGIDLLTVPARPAHWTRRLPLSNMIREIPAFWLYYVRAVLNVGQASRLPGPHGVPALAGHATEISTGWVWPNALPAKAGTPCPRT